MGRRVLVAAAVEAAKDLLRLLEPDGFGVDLAMRGSDALTEIWRRPPDLAIVSPTLPDVSVPGLIAGVRRDKWEYRGAFLALTPAADHLAVLDALAAGADWYVQLPYDADHLRGVVRLLAEGDVRERTRLEGDRRQLISLLATTSRQLAWSRQALAAVPVAPGQVDPTLPEAAAIERALERTQNLRDIIQELQWAREQALVYAREYRQVLEAEQQRSAELRQAIAELEQAQRQSLAYARDVHGAFESQRRRAEELRLALEELERSYDSTIEALSAALDSRDRETEGHSRRVTAYTMEIARALQVPHSELIHIERGAYLHDVGKIGIPDRILHKPGKLTEAEWAVMKRHPDLGFQMVRGIKFLTLAAPIILHHHERYDGTGYPLGLSGDAIHIGARIFAIADTFDAITADRPYRKGTNPEKARAEIIRASGRQFDPNVVEAFLRSYDTADIFRTAGATAAVTLAGLRLK